MLSKRFDHRSSHEEQFFDNSSTFSTQYMLLKIVPLRKSCAQNVQTGHQRDLRKTRHAKLIRSTQVYDKW